MSLSGLSILPLIIRMLCHPRVTGGVGSLAAGILSHLGYSVSAVTGKTETSLLSRLGVKKIISRNEFLENTKSAMLKANWAGVINIVGGDILATAIKSMKLDGVVACCGNVASADDMALGKTTGDVG